MSQMDAFRIVARKTFHVERNLKEDRGAIPPPYIYPFIPSFGSSALSSGMKGSATLQPCYLLACYGATLNLDIGHSRPADIDVFP